MVIKEEKRKNERAAVSRPTCPRCVRPQALCVCRALPDKKIITDTHVWILQHPNEFRKRNWSTVPLLKMLLENVTVKVGYTFDYDDLWGNTLATVDDRDHQNPTPLLLFPGPDAIDLDNLSTDADIVEALISTAKSETKLVNQTSSSLAQTMSNDGIQVLVLVDGTWSQAKRMLRESPTLVDRCTLVQFSDENQTSIYNAVRQEPKAHCLSTLEACAKALQFLENDQRKVDTLEYLQRTLEAHVSAHLQNAKAVEPRIQNKNDPLAKEKHREQIERAIFENTDGK